MNTKTRILAVLGSIALLLGDAGDLLAAQRGSRGSSVSPSRGASVSPSRGSSSRGSFSSPSRSSSFQGSRQSSRPSGGSSRPSVAPTPSRSTPSVRPSAPSVRPSLPQTVRPSTSPTRIAPTPSTARPPTTRPSLTPGASISPGNGGTAGAPGSSLSGTSLYGRRGLDQPVAPGASGGLHPNDSAPTAGPAPDSPGLVVPTLRTQPRVRFPTPYSPAGTTGRSSGSVRGIDVAPRGRTSVAPSAGRVGDSTTLSGRGVTATRDRAPARDVRPMVRYDRGPTQRTEPRTAQPKAVDPKLRTAPGGTRTGVSPGESRTGVSKSGVSKSGASRSGKSGGVKASPSSTSGEARGRTVTNWRDVKRSDPKAADGIGAATRLAGRGSAIATGVAAGAIGGVYPGSWRGPAGSYGGGWYYDPWGCDPGWGWSWSWSVGCGVSSSWWWWSYPCYWAWYYPTWWWCSRPYYYYDYVYYPATTVVYADPQVVYVERETAYVEEPVGEAVVQAPPATVPAPAAPESPLSIAAQRYLDLGDRAFREGRYTDAVQFYAKAVEFAPDQGALYLVLSDALFAAGDYHYGAYAVRRALELDPALVQSQVDKHGFYPDPALFDQQLATLERYLDQNATDRDARLVLAVNYLFGARPADAVRLIEGHSATMGSDGAAQLVLAQARANAGF